METLRRVVARLPADLPAAICIVLHIAPDSPSLLARILTRAGPLPCHAVREEETLQPGQILVAPPDRHLIVEDNHVWLSVGPRENGHRPSVDVLFRSAAEARGSRVIGVILSGTRGDGTLGLAAVKAAGGATIVQDPDEALYAGMPTSALAHIAVDSVVPSELVASTIVAMIKGQDPPPGEDHVSSAEADDPPAREATICPECGGVLTERQESGTTVWQCRVGHRYSPEGLLNAQALDVEAAMWAAVRVLEDRRRLLDQMADQFEASGQNRSARSIRTKARAAKDQAHTVREALMRATEFSLAKDDDEDAAPEDAGTRQAAGGRR